MRRLVLLVLACLLAALTGAAAVRFWKPSDPVERLVREFRLDSTTTERIADLHARHLAHCRELCDRIEASQDRLKTLSGEATTVTPEIRLALEESDRVRSDCRAAMLQHLYDVAGLLPVGDRERFLQATLPGALSPDQSHWK